MYVDKFAYTSSNAEFRQDSESGIINHDRRETQKVKKCITCISYQEKRSSGGTSCRWGGAHRAPV